MSRLYVGRLSHRVTERDLERFFKGFGRIRDIMLKNAYAFVEFEDYRDADDAMYELNGQTLCGERVAIEHAKGTPHGEDLRRDLERGISYPNRGGSGRREERYAPPRNRRSPIGGYKLIVENLSSKVTWQDLKDMVKKVGEVVYVEAHNNRRNEGVIEFASRKDMERAIDKFDGVDLNGRKIKLYEHRKNRDRSRSYSRSRSRSRSRHTKSRSRSHSRSQSKHVSDEEAKAEENHKSPSQNGKDADDD